MKGASIRRPLDRPSTRRRLVVVSVLSVVVPVVSAVVVPVVPAVVAPVVAPVAPAVLAPVFTHALAALFLVVAVRVPMRTFVIGAPVAPIANRDVGHRARHRAIPHVDERAVVAARPI